MTTKVDPGKIRLRERLLDGMISKMMFLRKRKLLHPYEIVILAD